MLNTYDFEEINAKIQNTEYKILNIREPIIFHNESVFSLGKYLSKKKYYAKSLKKYIEKWGKNDNDIKKQLGFKYRYFGVFLEDNKWKKAVTNLDLYLGLLLLRVLVGLAYVSRKLF